MSREAFLYAILRVVPRVERGEQINAGVVVFCRTRRFLACRIALDDTRRQALGALAPGVDLDTILHHLATIERIVRGDAAGGPIAGMDQPERFRWIVSPSSTIIQPSDVHTGLTDDPAATLEHLFATLVG